MHNWSSDERIAKLTNKIITFNGGNIAMWVLRFDIANSQMEVSVFVKTLIESILMIAFFKWPLILLNHFPPPFPFKLMPEEALHKKLIELPHYGKCKCKQMCCYTIKCYWFDAKNSCSHLCSLFFSPLTNVNWTRSI